MPYIKNVNKVPRYDKKGRSLRKIPRGSHLTLSTAKLTPSVYRKPNSLSKEIDILKNNAYFFLHGELSEKEETSLHFSSSIYSIKKKDFLLLRFYWLFFFKMFV